jgi:hypothetical protein
MHGNSILIHLKNLEHIYVGSFINKFRAVDEITDYMSPVGNNDVPYPVAYSVENVYLCRKWRIWKKYIWSLNQQYQIRKIYIRIIIVPSTRVTMI